MPTMSNPTTSKAGQPGHSLYTEYRRARDQHVLLRREKLARAVPRTAVRAAAVGLVLALVIAFGLGLPPVFPIVVFLLVFVGWPAVIIANAYNPVPDIEALREAATSEKITATTVSRLRRHGFIVMHDRSVPYSEATIGHLLVGPGGVMVISSDWRKGIVRYVKSGAQVDGDSLKPAIDRVAWLGGEVRTQLQAMMALTKIPVFPILVMAQADVLWSDGALDGVTIISHKDVVNFVRTKSTQLNPADVKKVAAAAGRLFPAYSSNLLAEHITVDRDQWLSLMDALRTIRERDGDASDLLDRLAQIEAELARQADPGRSGMPLAVAGGVTGAALSGSDPSDESAPGGGSDGELARVTSLASVPPKGATARRGRILATVRPPRDGHDDSGLDDGLDDGRPSP